MGLIEKFTKIFFICTIVCGIIIYLFDKNMLYDAPVAFGMAALLSGFGISTIYFAINMDVS